MRRRRLLTTLAAGAVVAAAGAAFLVERSAADVLACDPPTASALDATPTADGTASLDVVAAPGCPPVVVGTMSLDLLGFGDHNESTSTTPIFAVAWGLSNPLSQALAATGSGAGAAAGGPEIHDVTVTRLIDKASPVLMRSCATARNLSRAEIKLVRSPSDPTPYMSIVLTNVYCSGFFHSSTGDSGALESVQLSFGKVELRHTTKEGQVTRAGYDARQNIGF